MKKISWFDVKQCDDYQKRIQNTNSAKITKKTYTPPVMLRRDTGPRIPSLDTGHKGAVTVKQTPKYTGNKIVGIGTMHKSNAVPIFTDQEAKDISSMRR